MGKITKLMSAALALSVIGQALPSQPPVTAAEESFFFGDMNGDSRLTGADLILMRQAFEDSSLLTELTSVISDLDADGALDGDDLRLMQDFLLGKDPDFPAGEAYTPAQEKPYNGRKTLTTGRFVEKLDRGTYAVSAGGSVFVSWRLLADDEPDIGFNLYRTTGTQTVKLNDAPLTGGTNFTDTTADQSKDNTYFVTTVYNGVETPTDGDFTLKAGSSIYTKGNNGAAQVIPIKPGGTIHFVWVGDFNSDGAYD